MRAGEGALEGDSTRQPFAIVDVPGGASVESFASVRRDPSFVARVFALLEPSRANLARRPTRSGLRATFPEPAFAIVVVAVATAGQPFASAVGHFATRAEPPAFRYVPAP